MAPEPVLLSGEALEFVTERHLATLSLLRPDGSIHVTPIGFTWDTESGLARVITWFDSYKVTLAAISDARATICQVDGGRWLSLEGEVSVAKGPETCADAEQRYTERYQPPRKSGEGRRVIEIAVSRVLCSSGLK